MMVHEHSIKLTNRENTLLSLGQLRVTLIKGVFRIVLLLHRSQAFRYLNAIILGHVHLSWVLKVPVGLFHS
jgi:hypothetical protein